MASGDSLMSWDALAARPLGTTHASLDLRNAIPVLDFDDTVSESIFFSGFMPRHYAGGGITVTTVWAGSVSTTGNVKWETAIERSNTSLNSDSFAAGQSTVGAVAGSSGVPTLTETVHLSGAQMDGLLAGEPFRLKLTRIIAGVTGNMTGDAEVVVVELRET